MQRRTFLTGAFATLAVGGTASILYIPAKEGDIPQPDAILDDTIVEKEDDLQQIDAGNNYSIFSQQRVEQYSPFNRQAALEKGDRVIPSTKLEKSDRLVPASPSVVENKQVIEAQPVIEAKPVPEAKPVILEPESGLAFNAPIPTKRPIDADKVLRTPSLKDRTRTREKPEAKIAEVEDKPRKSLFHIFRPASRGIRFVSVNTGEKMTLDFRNPDRSEIDRFMRDWRRDEEKHISEKLIARFGRVVQTLNDGGADINEMHLISGYRSKKTNDALRGDPNHGGQAQFSQHILAKAMDIRTPGTRLSNLHKAAVQVAKAEGSGGVGFYPSDKTNFVHIDVAGLRFWS